MNVIEVRNLSKRYVIGHQKKKSPSSFRELLEKPFNRLMGKKPSEIIVDDDQSFEKEEFWALKDINFEVRQGERIAIIGGNGAGKSTLLKILSRITEPTDGSIKIKGKVASLLEVGTGFHPELTGRENVFLNGAVLGMRKSEVSAKFDRIVAFSGVEKFIDTPVKHYSSGMYVRLAFSVSAWLDPEILIVDEVLSVGDQAFQRRCAERMKELTGEGRTVLFVSHSMQTVRAMCEKALYLEKGSVLSFSDVDEVAAQYIRSIDDGLQEQWHRATFYPSAYEFHANALNEHVQCICASVIAHGENTATHVEIHQPFTIRLCIEIKKTMPWKTVPNFHFYDETGTRFFISFPEYSCPQNAGMYEIDCHVPPFLFNNGRYTTMVALSSFELENPVHFSYEDALRFEVVESTGADSWRHGWSGALPGMTRPRLNWAYKAI